MKSFFKKFGIALLSFFLFSNVANAQNLLHVSPEIDLASPFNTNVIYQNPGQGKKTLITDIFVVVTDTNISNDVVGYFSVNVDDHSFPPYWFWAWSYPLTGLTKVGQYMRLDPTGVHSLVEYESRVWLHSVSIPMFSVPNPTFKVRAYVFGYEYQ
jgi:hypothetical protein